MVSSGAIVNRKAEHLGTTDRGVVLFRRMLANAMRAVADGATPALPCLYQGQTPVRTYAHEIVLRLPRADMLSDRQALAQFGRRAASVFVEMDDVALERRNEVAAQRIRKILDEFGARGKEAITQS